MIGFQPMDCGFRFSKRHQRCISALLQALKVGPETLIGFPVIIMAPGLRMSGKIFSNLVIFKFQNTGTTIKAHSSKTHLIC